MIDYTDIARALLKDIKEAFENPEIAEEYKKWREENEESIYPV